MQRCRWLESGEDTGQPVVEGLVQQPVCFVDYLYPLNQYLLNAAVKRTNKVSKVLERESWSRTDVIHQSTGGSDQDVDLTGSSL
jgi:hypothetical protein